MLRTVFFSTRDIQKNWAFQGVTKLVSHKNTKGAMTRATGFLGEPKGYMPVTERSTIPKFLQCDGVGTDIIIVGFDEKTHWQEQLIAAFAENFFVAIHDGSLEVAIQHEEDSKAFHELTSVTLSNVISALAHRNERYRYLLDFYDALTSPEAIITETDIEGLGKLKLKLLPREGARKRVAMFRRTGMKIFEKDRFRTPLEFAGVFQCEGEEGNRLLRRLEPPSHDKWEPERYEESPRHASSLIKAISEWMRKCVQELLTPDAGETQAIPGLERLLPDDFEEPFDKASKALAEGDPRPKVGEGIKGVARPPKAKPGNEATTLGLGESGAGDTDGAAGDGGGGTTGGANGSGSGDGRGSGPVLQDVNIEYRTFLDAASSRYRMMAKFVQPGIYDVHVLAIGDDGRAEPIDILDPKLVVSGKTSKASVSGQNKISKVNVAGPSSIEIQFSSPSMIPRTLLAKVQRHVQ
ncbi:hypothetical protein D0B54_01725 [Solimonas sp. K1W22B-7]|nr:hypothetical protein D0B54_01725 [Solimonas sp. K1W22B-7]